MVESVFPPPSSDAPALRRVVGPDPLSHSPVRALAPCEPPSSSSSYQRLSPQQLSPAAYELRPPVSELRH